MTAARRARRPVLAAIALALAACAPPAASPSAPRPQTSTSTASTTTSEPSPTPAPRQPSPASTRQPAPDRLERDHRLAQALPHSTPHYRIDFTVGADGRLHLQVTLLAELNRADDVAGYQAALRRYKTEALEFIRAQGDDPAGYTVGYLPPEAAAL